MYFVLDKLIPNKIKKTKNLKIQASKTKSENPSSRIQNQKSKGQTPKSTNKNPKSKTQKARPQNPRSRIQNLRRIDDFILDPSTQAQTQESHH